MNAEEKLQALIEQGLVSAEQLEELERKDVKGFREVADSMHTLFCHEDHELGACRWYEEECLNEAWELPDHETKFVEAQELGEKFQLNAESLLRALRLATGLHSHFVALKLSEDIGIATRWFLKELLSSSASTP